MKKPNITNGEWEQDGETIFLPMAGYDIGIAKCHTKSFSEERKANAQAISAVPEMIEALIEAEHIMQSVRNGYHVDYDKADEVWKSIFFALQKAGVTINEKEHQNND